MTSITYDDVFDKFIGSIEDIELTSLNVSDAYTLMAEYLHKSVSEMFVRRLFSSITLDDDVQRISFEMNRPYEESADIEFVTSALSKWMVYEWLHKQTNSRELTAQVFAGKEIKYYSQSSQLDSVRALKDDAYKEARQYINDRGLIQNSYIGGAK